MLCDPCSTSPREQQGFIQEFFLWLGNVDACNGYFRASIIPLGFGEALHIFKTRIVGLSFKPIANYAMLCYCVVYPL